MLPLGDAPLPPAGGVGGGPTPSPLRGSSPPASGKGEIGDRGLVRLYWPAHLRSAFDALFALEDVLLGVARTSTQPALGAIRMAWWRDALRRLDEAPPPGEPHLQAIAAQLRPRAVGGAELAAVAEGYATLFDPTPDLNLIGAAGRSLFAAGARVLGAEDDALGEAARRYALARVARLGLIAEAPPPLPPFKHRFARKARPLTALARLAERDLRALPAVEPEATPARAAALLAHRFTGAIA